MTERSYQVVVTGGGASGMTAAILAARSGLRTAVLETNDMVGKKLLATGNGKCNFTNSRQLPDCYRGRGAETAMRLLERYDVHRVLSFFEELGIYPKQRNGYWYPNSEQAASVREALLEELLRCGVDVITCCRVKSVRRLGDNFRELSQQRDGKESARAARFPHGPRFEITAGWREKKSAPDGRKKKEKREKPQYSEERDILFEADYVVLA
ncbi:MAG: NAD(P)/FAD-dependent oxidoreductase, partial [Lachnospiraceae bacterium]|nr:NAD(P)/FAD-dependent oxidoreductase [Lachnospiraceae bacterium]